MSIRYVCLSVCQYQLVSDSVPLDSNGGRTLRNSVVGLVLDLVVARAWHLLRPLDVLLVEFHHWPRAHLLRMSLLLLEELVCFFGLVRPHIRGGVLFRLLVKIFAFNFRLVHFSSEDFRLRQFSQ